MVKRYLQIQAIRYQDQLIPVWDEKVIYEKNDYFGSQYKYNGLFCECVTCYYDTKKKAIFLGVEINYNPPLEKLQYKINETVLIETDKFRELKEVKIVNISFDEYEERIIKGKDLEGYEAMYNMTFERNQIYHVKTWKPTYHFSDNSSTSRDHTMYKKYENS